MCYVVLLFNLIISHHQYILEPLGAQDMSAFLAPILTERRKRLAAGPVEEDDFLWKAGGEYF